RTSRRRRVQADGKTLSGCDGQPHGVAQDLRAGRKRDLLRTAERDRPFGALYEGGSGIAQPDGHVVDHHTVGAERVRQPNPYLLAAEADVDDLAQRLVVESGT